MISRSLLLVGTGLLSLVATACSYTPAADPASVLSANSVTRTVDLYLTAGYNSNNMWNNYDGYAHGKMIVTVPLGYRVRLHFTNDGGIPYSVGIYDANQRVAFKGAGNSIADYDFNPTLGIVPGDSATYSFTASQIGTFYIANYLYRFPSHQPTNVALGMWDTLRIVPSGNPNVSVM
ncbi:sulfocyanin-like copper-binding protein [Sulfoacidibacillus thermotolerans]|uniref:Sulfocyanin-like C-terminal domain-containing protein n=1 Tax=Sulfoacidibacillus thermotolerans TaxID=1765684 RepID=A0A2U3D962_SULT2|nr:sulfocyanin-like copper-binding protein [Sulfoacidibacillus thermotolerans]PWI57820.1 hypothetical protein BM613_06410 [Sulfoacidibacillus thermotolerans]